MNVKSTKTFDVSLASMIPASINSYIFNGSTLSVLPSSDVGIEITPSLTNS